MRADSRNGQNMVDGRPGKSFAGIMIIEQYSFARLLVLQCLALIFAGWSQAVLAESFFPSQPRALEYATEPAFPGLEFEEPVGIVSPPNDPRIFVLEKRGRIMVIHSLEETPTAEVYLDLRDRVVSEVEQGLLGLAFHPDFSENHRLFVFYCLETNSPSGSGPHNRLSEFRQSAENPNQVDIESEIPLISQYDEAPHHNAGDLHFGKDGYLYLSVGDEGLSYDALKNSQRIDKDFFSGILRIDVDNRPGNLPPNEHPASHGGYSVPVDNPFVGATEFAGSSVNPENVRTELFAVGMRNPWRMSLDPSTGLFFANDVGQDRREEANLIVPGGNYGWLPFEGDYFIGNRWTPKHDHVVALPPIIEYDRTYGTSITAALFYDGHALPELKGHYLFSDFYGAKIAAIRMPEAAKSRILELVEEIKGASGIEMNSLWTELGETLRDNRQQPRTLVNFRGASSFGVDPLTDEILIANFFGNRIDKLVRMDNAITPPPPTLSATGIFADLETLEPVEGVIPYEINHPFWSDYALKSRWVTLNQSSGKIRFEPSTKWLFPPGTVWVKHFDLEMKRGEPTSARRVETRFLVKTESGVYGLSYQWRDNQSDADIVPIDGTEKTLDIEVDGAMTQQTWRFPSASQCIQCHTSAGGLALGFHTAQLNRTVLRDDNSVNQIEWLQDIGFFENMISDPDGLNRMSSLNDSKDSLDERVNSYFAANCVQCHFGAGSGRTTWDARFDTDLGAAGLVNETPVVGFNPQPDMRLIKPGSTSGSMLYVRLADLEERWHMPPLATSVVNRDAVILLEEWILSGLNSAGSVHFLKQDNESNANGSDSYGSEGWLFAADGPFETEFALNWELAQGFKEEWDASSESASLRIPETEERVAQAWAHPDAVDVKIEIGDGNFHEVALYMADWGNAGRRQKVQWRDGESGDLLDERTVGDFSQGVYLVWEIRGNLDLRIDRLAGPDAVLSALFFDPSRLSDLHAKLAMKGVDQSSVRLLFESEPGYDWNLEYSFDLEEWRALAPIRLYEKRSSEISLPLETDSEDVFFIRATSWQR